jgi:hypothetical protein
MVFSWPLKTPIYGFSFNGHEYVIQFIAITNYLFNGHEYAAFNGHEYVAKFMAIQNDLFNGHGYVAFNGNDYVAFNGHDCIFYGKINDSLRILWPFRRSILKGFSWGVFMGFHGFFMLS